ncbi:hypothetical protein [Mumia zhuanghuii]|uniref:ABC-2 type transport system permease protein n=1 Tax=Mumia zhuanghuii TaxID=2585211 RepID=A0A5C4MQC3_9ACTN|nr:hypothetical protein [Mumia zhuanghuii]TNC48061.1 hypothetical protein FHE65_07995 [Mumia zhuanghuii]TNC50982.1 hypothetical protein FHE65_03150 [Mumia zhuanghuii]
MVAVVLRLKLTLVLNRFRRSVWQTVGFVLAALYALMVVGLVAAGSVGLSFVDADRARDVLVVGGAVAVVGWWLLPLLSFGLDATLDPRRFQLYAIRRRDLVVGLALAGLIGVPGIATLLAALSTSLAWWDAPLALLAGVVGAVVGVAMCAVGSRTLAAVVAPLIEWRRFREIATVLVIVPLVMLGPLLGRQIDRLGELDSWLPRLADVLSWTPFGAPWSLGGDVAEGEWMLAGARLLVSLAAVGLLLVAWDSALARTLVRPPSRGPVARGEGYGWFDRLPATRTGAIAARCLTYWQRDPRYAGSVAFLPFLPIPFLVLGGFEGNTSLLWLAPIIAYTLGFAISADLAYDSTAFWLHLSAGVRGVTDRWGRVLSASVLAVPMIVLFAIGAVWATGEWATLVAVLGASAGVLMVTLGASSVLSARYLYPVQKPGEGVFSQPQGSTTAILVAQTVGVLVVGVLCLPTLAAFIVVLVSGALWATVLTVALGVSTGVAVLIIGVRKGGEIVDRRGPEILQQIDAWA